jgi:hypothetical protein
MFLHLKPSLKPKAGIPPAFGQPRKMAVTARIVELSALQFAQPVFLPICGICQFAESVKNTPKRGISLSALKHPNYTTFQQFTKVSKAEKMMPCAEPW